MTKQRSMMGLGMQGQLAQAVVGGMQLAQTATGSSQATAFALTSSHTEFTTTGASTGAVLPGTAAMTLIGDKLYVFNMGASTLSVYPPSGFKINLGTQDAAVSITTLKTACFICKGDGNWYALLSA